MEKAEIQVNDILQVKPSNDPNALPCASRVEDIEGQSIVIAWPSDRGILIPTHEGRVLSLSFVRDDAAYVFTAKVLAKGREPIPYIKLLPLGPATRLQRRDFVRVEVSVNVELSGVVITPSDNKETVIRLREQTVDLSGGGLAIRTGSSLPPGSLLDAKLALPDGRAPINTLVRVMGVSTVLSGGIRSINHIRMSFSVIKENERKRIIRFLFRTQVRQRAALVELEVEKKTRPKQRGKPE